MQLAGSVQQLLFPLSDTVGVHRVITGEIWHRLVSGDRLHGHSALHSLLLARRFLMGRAPTSSVSFL